MSPTMQLTPGAYIPPGNAGPGWAFVVCVLLLGVGLGGVLVYMFVRARSLARAQAHENAEMRERAARPLSRGPSRVVRGTVDLDGTDGVAVEIDIEQSVRDHKSKNSSWHTWTETGRRTRSVPFYLVRPDGEAVYVEPGPDLLIVDSLVTRYPNETPRCRVRAADVRRGEELHVYGDLQEGMHPRARGAYREASGWILRPPRSGPMLLATEAIRDRYGPRVSYLLKAGTIVTIALLALHGLFTAPFLSAMLFGARTTADVVDRPTWITHGKHGSTTHYGLTVRAADGYTLRQEVPRETYVAIGAAPAREGRVVVPLIRTFDWESATFVGDQPYVSLFWIIGGCIALPFLLLGLRTSYQMRRAWYDKRKLVEHGGSGRWVETRPHGPIDPSTN